MRELNTNFMSRLRNDKMRAKVNALRARGLSYWEVTKMLEMQPSLVRYYANNEIEKRRIKRQNEKQKKSNMAVNIDKTETK